MQSSEWSIVEALGFAEVAGIDALVRFFKAAVSLEEMLRRVEGAYPGASSDLGLVRRLSAGDVDALSSFPAKIREFAQAAGSGICSRGGRLMPLITNSGGAFGFASPDAPHTRLADMERIRNIAQVLRSEMERLPTTVRGDGLMFCQMVLIKPEQRSFLGRLAELAQGAERLRGILSKYPSTMKRLGIREADFGSVRANRLTAKTADDFAILVRYVSLAQQLHHAFHEIPAVILDFFEFISNYHAQLLKHFRSYKELISYSNENFYRGKLQVMKIRGKNIDEVFQIHDLAVVFLMNPPAKTGTSTNKRRSSSFGTLKAEGTRVR